jgi:hypothetical protein
MPRLSVVGLLLALIVAGSDAFAAPRQVPSPAIDPAVLAGSWIGAWKGANFVYDAQVNLNVSAAGEVSGIIGWTLRSAPNSGGKGKTGQRAIEYVRGKYYPESEAVVLEGYRKDDPNGIWELDKYRLILSPTHQTMGGITGEHESWAGQLFLQRDSDNAQ